MQKCIVVCVLCNICAALSDYKKMKRKKATVQKKNTEVKKKPHQTKKSERKEEEKKEEQNSEVLASFVSFCRVVWLPA